MDVIVAKCEFLSTANHNFVGPLMIIFMLMKHKTKWCNLLTNC